jgi:hypothetical protein
MRVGYVSSPVCVTGEREAGEIGHAESAEGLASNTVARVGVAG